MTLFPHEGQKLKLMPVERACSIVIYKFTSQCGQRASVAVFRTIQNVKRPSTVDATKKAIFASGLFNGINIKPKIETPARNAIKKEICLILDFL